MPTVAQNTTAGGGKPGVARNMPMTAQKTISDTTRGFVNAMKCLSRVSESASDVMGRGLCTTGVGASALMRGIASIAMRVAVCMPT